ncbi:MAG: zinc ribbon domain-containing protein [archaeon]
MWYNDLLMILMGFVAVLMIVMALVVFTRVNKPSVDEEEEEADKILVEKGFEKERDTEEPESNETSLDTTKPITEKKEEPKTTDKEKENRIEVTVSEEIESSTEEEVVEITPVEKIIVEPESKEKETLTTETNEEVVITPNETFYELEPKDETHHEEEPEKTDIPEVEKPLPEIEDPEEEQGVTKEKPKRRIRKPVIDESDPDLKIDLGVETCPHCGSKVPNTIYCINCGGALDPENTIGLEEE